MNKRENIKTMSRVCFIVYMIVLVYLLFLSDGFGRGNVYSEFRFNMVPFREITRYLSNWDRISIELVVINVIGNVAAFMPFGALIRWVLNRRIHWYQAVFYTFLFSFSVEYVQLISRVGVFDVDDLILNTLGGLFGFWVYYLLKVVNKRRENSNEGK